MVEGHHLLLQRTWNDELPALPGTVLPQELPIKDPILYLQKPVLDPVMTGCRGGCSYLLVTGGCLLVHPFKDRAQVRIIHLLFPQGGSRVNLFPFLVA